MKINETHPREKGFVLWGHCQNILDDPCTFSFDRPIEKVTIMLNYIHCRVGLGIDVSNMRQIFSRFKMKTNKFAWTENVVSDLSSIT